jgi:hypothetical protein
MMFSIVVSLRVLSGSSFAAFALKAFAAKIRRDAKRVGGGGSGTPGCGTVFKVVP